MRILGIITARGGSKVLPRKNIRLLAGKPLIYYTIKEAGKSKHLTKTIVDTDDEEIAKIARSFGAKVPFLRPKELATDEATTLSVVQHAIRELEKKGEHYDYIMILQPTSPLRLVEDIDGAIEKALNVGADSLISVVRVYDFHPLRIKKMDERGFLSPYFEPEPEGLRRQDLPPVYKRNGAIYLVKKELVMEKNTLYGDKLYGYEMSEERSVDIHSEIDFLLAELLIKKRVVRQ